MRKYYKHGKTRVDNQIILDTGCYTAFERNGQAWIKVMGLERGKRIAIPLNGNRLPKGTLRLILRNGHVEVHYTVSSDECCTKPSGYKEVGVDKGYGEIHGEGLGNVVSICIKSPITKIYLYRDSEVFNE